MEIVSSSEYEADVQRAMGKSSVSGAKGKGDPFEDFLSEDSCSCLQVIPGIHEFTPAERQAIEAKLKAGSAGILPEGQNSSPVLPHPAKYYGDSRDSALIPRAFGPHESESYQRAVANVKRSGWGLMPPECAKYTYHLPPPWYTYVLNAPLNAREQQEDGQDSSVAMDEEQARALTAEYHQAVGQSLNQALDNLGIRENDFDGHHTAFHGTKLREELSRIMNSDPRTKELMSLLGVEV
jgi:hypothetical protein